MTFKLIEFLVTYKNPFGEVDTRYTYAENWREAKRNWESSQYGNGKGRENCEFISAVPKDKTDEDPAI